MFHRTTIATLIAALALAAGATGVASAAVRTTTQTATHPSTTTVAAAERNTIGGATGDGPADDGLCQAWADYSDAQASVGDELYDEGHLEEALTRYETAHNIINSGMSQGCFFTEEG